MALTAVMKTSLFTKTILAGFGLGETSPIYALRDFMGTEKIAIDGVVPDRIAVASPMAGHKLGGSLCVPVVCHGSRAGRFLLADAADRDFCRGLSGTHLYHFSRLRPRLVLWIEARQQRNRCHCGYIAFDALSTLALAACPTPRNGG